MTAPARYRHRPTVIIALQYTRATASDVHAWLAFEHPSGFDMAADQLVIETPEGDRDCSPDDGYWIVKGIRGEFYPVSDEVFRAAYEPADGAM